MTPPPVLFKAMSFESAPATSGPVADATTVGLRVAAAAVDCGVGFVLFLILAATIGTFDTSHGLVIRLDGLANVPWLAALFLYVLVCETLAGATLGKAALGLRVVDARDGSRPGVRAVALRTLLQPLDALPFFYGLGLALVLATPGHQRLGDLVARTVVVSERP